MLANEMILVDRPVAEVTSAHFQLEQRPVRALEFGEALVKAKYLSIEPLLRGRLMSRPSYASAVEVGQCMTGRALCEVLDSRDSTLSKGDLVEYWHGWRDLGVGQVSQMRRVKSGPWPQSASLSLFGPSGYSAFFALTRIGQIGASDTVVVSSAAGAVGSIAVQIALRRGARVIGIAGGPAKVTFVRDVLGAHAALDYKTEQDLPDSIFQLAPKGVDVFLDSVGGAVHDAVMPNLALHARVIVFGTMDYYSDPSRSDYGRRWLRDILIKRAIISGFLLQDHAAGFGEAQAALEEWWRAGSLVSREEIRDGIENAPQALADVIAGRAMGKMLIRT